VTRKTGDLDGVLQQITKLTAKSIFLYTDAVCGQMPYSKITLGKGFKAIADGTQ